MKFEVSLKIQGLADRSESCKSLLPSETVETSMDLIFIIPTLLLTVSWSENKQHSTLPMGPALRIYELQSVLVFWLS